MKQNCDSENEYGFYFHPEDITKTYSNLEDISVAIFHSYHVEQALVESINRSTGELLFQRRNRVKFPVGNFPSGGWRYSLHNVFEELDSPGEFYCDRKSNRLYAYTVESTEIPSFLKYTSYLSQLETLVSVVNSQNVKFSKVSFAYTSNTNVNSNRPEPISVDIKDSKNVLIQSVGFSHMGYTGLQLYNVANTEVKTSFFHNIGGRAITMDDRWYDYDTASTDVLIHQNVIDYCEAKLPLWRATCIMARGRKNIKVWNNKVLNSPSSGVRAGYQYPAFQLYERGDSIPEFVYDIRKNHVENFGHGIINDFGAYYLSSGKAALCHQGVSGLCEVRAKLEMNIAKNGKPFDYGGVLGYTDSGAGSIHFVKNLGIQMGPKPTLAFHCGMNNKFINNVVNAEDVTAIVGGCTRLTSAADSLFTLEIKKNIFDVHANCDSFDYFRPVDYVSPRTGSYKDTSGYTRWNDVQDNIYHFTNSECQPFHNNRDGVKNIGDWRNKYQFDLNSLNQTQVVPSFQRSKTRTKKEDWGTRTFRFNPREFQGKRLSRFGTDVTGVKISGIRWRGHGFNCRNQRQLPTNVWTTLNRGGTTPDVRCETI